MNRETILLIADGNETAFSDFFNYWYPHLRLVVSRFFSDKDQVEDILQESFIRVWLNRDQLPAVENMGGWLHTIASRVCISEMRKVLRKEKQTRDLTVHKANEVDFVVERISLSEINRLIATVVDKMPSARKNIYLMSRGDGLKPSEIADKLSLSVNTVRNVLVTALKEIREYLTVHGHTLLLVITLGFYW